MKVTIQLPAGALTLAQVPDALALAVIEEWRMYDNPVIAFTLGEDSIVHLARSHIHFIAVDPDDVEPPKRVRTWRDILRTKRRR